MPHKIEHNNPILWLEGLDKFVPTQARLNHLFTLVEALYSRNGVIVAMADMTADELRDHLGEPIYRRVSGQGEPEKKTPSVLGLGFSSKKKGSM
jgi:hypothetical protein